jgi:cytochrome c oxidase cbb3-type subunit 4
MDTYSLLREIADSWVLLLMVAFFVGAGLWAWRPGSAALHRDAASVPFRHDDAPIADDPVPAERAARPGQSPSFDRESRT